MPQPSEVTWAMLEAVPSAYWLQVCNGSGALNALLSEQDISLQEYPLVAFPLLPRAIRVLGEFYPDDRLRQRLLNISSDVQSFQLQLRSGHPQEHAQSLSVLAVHFVNEQGGNYQLNLRTAILLYQEARKALPGDGLSFAICLMNEGVARHRLAEQGVETLENLRAAIQLSREAQKISPDAAELVVGCLLVEGVARRSLAEYGVDVRENLLAAIQIYKEAHRFAPEGSLDAARCLLNESNIRKILAEQGVETRENLMAAVELCREARKGAVTDREVLGGCLMNEGVARKLLAEQGVDTRANLLAAIKLYQDARGILPAGDHGYAKCYINEGNAWRSLAEQGVDVNTNLLAAIKLYREVRPILPEGSLDFARCAWEEGNALSSLAEAGVDARTNLLAAIELYREARRITPEGSSAYARCLWNEGNAWYHLAGRDDDTRENLLTACRLQQEARAHTPTGSLDFAVCLVNESSVRVSLADEGVSARENLSEAVSKCDTAIPIFKACGSTLNVIKGYTVLGDACMKLARDSDGAQRRHWWEKAREGLGAAVEMIEQVRAGLRLGQDRQALIEQNVRIFRTVVEAYVRLELYEEALEYIERGRSRLLLDLLYFRDFAPRNVPPETAKEYQALLERANELDRLLSADASPGASETSGAAGQRELSWRQERERVLDSLREKEEEIRRLDPDYFILGKPADRAAMRRTAAAANRTLVTFWVGRELSVTFFVRPSGEFHVVPLEGMNTRVLDELIFGARPDLANGWYTTYRNYQNGSVDLLKWTWQIDETVAELQQRLIGPVREQLRSWGDSRVVFFVSGLLGLLPLHMAAQTLEANSTADGVDALDVIYSPSVWVLQRCLERERSRETPVGIVATSGSGPKLYFAPWEQEGIRRRIAERKGARACKCLPAARKPATAEIVSEFLSTLSVAHFSCHGSWNPSNPLDSALSLDGGSSLSLATLLGPMRCDRARLVVLSACESAIGMQTRWMSEEFLGLPAGFLFAGARSVIGSLWPVPDLSTSLLMQRLYDELLAGREVPLALRLAQEWLRTLERSEVETLVKEADSYLDEQVNFELDGLSERPFSHPYYWGAFQVLGNPAPVFRTAK